MIVQELSSQKNLKYKNAFTCTQIFQLYTVIEILLFQNNKIFQSNLLPPNLMSYMPFLYKVQNIIFYNLIYMKRLHYSFFLL